MDLRREVLGGVAERRIAGGALTLVWLLGLHLLPLGHNIDHSLDHTHGPTQGPHPHPHPHPEDSGNEPAGSDHGAGSLLHYALAVLEEKAPVLVEPGPDVEPLGAPAPIRLTSIALVAHFARGPPSLLT